MKNCYWQGLADGSGYAEKTSTSSLALKSASLFVDYIYLDTDERRRFAQVSHEYLIEQLQFTGDESVSSTSPKIKLNFNHPVKELIWVVQKDSNVLDTVDYGKQWFNYTDDEDKTLTTSGAWTGSNATLVNPGDNYAGSMPGVAAGGANNVFIPVSFEDGVNPVAKAKLLLNGHDRFSERDGRYFNLVQPYQHHENVPSQGINVYSFGLKPEEHQPSGTCNMSRIDNATLQLTLTKSDPAKVRVYAVNYNVLRIMSGMGGLALKIARAEKLQAIVNLALTIVKSLWIQAKNPVASIGYLRCDISCCGKLLKLVLPTDRRKLVPAKKKLGYGHKKQDTTMDNPHAYWLTEPGRQRLNGYGWVLTHLLKIQSSFLRNLEDKKKQLNVLLFFFLLYNLIFDR